ncbi:MAG: hypothetical protein MK211_02390 [Flavobacteriales bacterium]|jgi:hypothetical protein|uniref:hypothetical protein n=1 Tax=Candidatus Ulvibacter alkanivorans TaxID=2267620 RepID=UPI000DF3E366|nr:hypothetical protein [Candidatus Ulvibacter alkanivorans]MCH2488976.1 hypothetical protein [Flavobacteriales bacterium]
MKLIHRIAYYLGGFIIGIIILLFFLGGKKASCDYSPNARTLKNIRLKERSFSSEALMSLRTIQLDTSAISQLLIDGNVLFSESNTDLDSCKQYVIEGVVQTQNLRIRFENCKTKATLLSVDTNSN